MTRLFSHQIRIIVLICAFFSLAFTMGAASTPKERRETFNLVWSRVNERFYDPKFNGVNWKSIKIKYSKKLTSVKTDDQLYALLNNMLEELKCSHFAVIPPSAYIETNDKAPENKTSDLDTESDSNNESEPDIEPSSDVESDSYAGSDSDVGLTVQVVEGKPTITRTEPDSPAAQVGLRPGFIITHLDDTPLSDLQKKIASRKERPAMSNLLLSQAVESILSGDEGSEIEIRYLDDKDIAQKVVLKRRVPRGKPVKFGEMPRIYVTEESRRLSEGIGYVRYNIFLLKILDKIKADIRSFANAPGIIIDLRGNPGGIGGMAPPIAALFHSQRVSLGAMKMRKGEIRFVVFPVSDPYKKKLVILIDETSASTSEVMAGGMQANKRAIIVGQVSAGAALPSMIEKLPTGARLQYAIADFKTPKGVTIEGRGVIPDVKVAPTRRDLLEGRDPIIERAVELILNADRQKSEQSSLGSELKRMR
jgi:carboxyl-terminal processing protease